MILMESYFWAEHGPIRVNSKHKGIITLHQRNTKERRNARLWIMHVKKDLSECFIRIRICHSSIQGKVIKQCVEINHKGPTEIFLTTSVIRS